MDSAGGTAAQSTTNASSSDSASAKPELDMSAINEAIAQTANDPSTAVQQTFDVNEISLDNTPTTDAGLEQQQASNPGMNLANSGAAASATAAGEEEKPAAPAAAFVDGDIVDEAPKEEEKPAAKAVDYDAALNADPLASFEDPAAPAAPAAAAAAAPSGEVDPSTLDEPDPAPAPAPAPVAPTPDPVAAAQAGDVTDTNAPLPAPVEKKDDEEDDEDGEKAKKPKKGEIHFNIDFDKILHSNAAIIGIIVGAVILVLAIFVIANL